MLRELYKWSPCDHVTASYVPGYCQLVLTDNKLVLLTSEFVSFMSFVQFSQFSCLVWNLNYFFILKRRFFPTILAVMVQRTMQAIHITLHPSLSCDLCLLLFSETIVKWRFILRWTSSKLLVLRPPDLIMQFDWLTLKHLLLKKTSVVWNFMLQERS